MPRTPSQRASARRSHTLRHACRFEPLEVRRLLAGGPDPDPIIPDDYEPNNSFAAASNLGAVSGASVDFLTLHNLTTLDIDYFKFTAPAGQSYVAQIFFSHSDGNLKLTAYDAAQQQIGFSDSSTVGSGRETITIAAQTGQTYFLKIHGAASHDYSLNLKTLNASFDWSMSRRTATTFDSFGYPVYPNTRDYARPNPVWINGVETPRYGTILSASGATTGDGITYNWSITSPQYSTTASGASALVDLPQGTYTATLTATLNGSSVSTTQTIAVRDILLVAIGDSYGSGESNPHSPVQYDLFGFPTRGAVWAYSPDPTEALYHRMAHRSSRAAVAQAAWELENADPKTSVTFVFLDHTGATIPVGLLGSQPSGDHGVSGSTPPQLDRLAQIVGDRRIDQMVISIGGNDLGFGSVLASLVTTDPVLAGGNYYNELQAIFDTALDNVQTLGSTGYPALAQRLANFNIGQTFLVEYPDLTKDTSGQFAEQILHDILVGLEADRYELQRAYNALVEPLQTTMRTACRKFGWTYVDGVDEQYSNHGYGDWLRTAVSSAITQGPIGNVNLPTTLDLQATVGTMHPIEGGLTAQRTRITANWNLPNLMASAFSISPSAFLPTIGGSTFSLTVTNTSFNPWAAASMAQVYVSPDGTVDRNDHGVAQVNIPALAPGQSITVTGSLPALSDPYHAPGNVLYVAPVVDVNYDVIEHNEVDNLATNTRPAVALTPERDLRATPAGLRLNATYVATSGSSTFARLGLDEVIGDSDLDVYVFDVAAGERLGFDVDSPGTLDTYIRVFPVANDAVIGLTPLDANDNGRAPGETGGNGLESYLRYTFAQAGRYALVVGHEMNRNAEPMHVGGRAHAVEGQYTLNISRLETVAPTVQSSGFEVDGNRLSFRFSEDVGGSIGNSVLSLTNLDNGASIPVTASYDVATHTARFTFNGFAAGLPTGNYRATIPAGAVFDPSGNTLAADATLSFFALPGDANRDRAVTIADFATLASRFNATGTFTQGDFNYSGTVEIGDFSILAASFNRTLAGGSIAMPARSAPGAGAIGLSVHRSIIEELWPIGDVA